MPGGDRTGPLGMGPMTGRAAGYCAGYNHPGYLNPMPGRCFGFGRGFGGGRGRGGFGSGLGRGWGAWGMSSYPYAAPYYPPEISSQQEADLLKEQAKAMQEEIKAINERIKALESAQSFGEKG